MLTASGLFAHPMGNFSVSHYAKLALSERGVEIEYALDLAEIPTFELLRAWGVERNSPASELQTKAEEKAREWIENLEFTLDGQPIAPRLQEVRVVVADGAGNLPIVRVTMLAHISARGANLEYEDNNFPDRAGWKEIVIDAVPPVVVQRASQSSRDISKALTHYPPDPTIAPPQDLRARVSWKINALPATNGREPAQTAIKPVVTPIPQPNRAPVASAPALMTKQKAPPGTIVRGDFLSKLLHQSQWTISILLLAIGVSFLLGAAHALTPGHGKTIVAAYLVGSRGTLKHAAFLGAMVTSTHTAVVFALGATTLLLFRYVVPERITQVLGAISGVSIVVLGAWMLRKRILTARAHLHGNGHAHTHAHHEHGHHEHEHGHNTHRDHVHHEHGHTHSHIPDELSWKALVALGASGGLVPCESALVLLLGSIAIGRVGLGLILLVSFSLGLASVLIAIGVLVLYAKKLIPEGKRSGNLALLRWVSIASPAIVMLIGVVMTGVSLGLIRPEWSIG